MPTKVTGSTSDGAKGTGQSSISIPEELKEKYPELIELILGSESMNDEERQYWVNILPVMTSEQRDNLKQILQNEKDQLAAIDAKYSKEMERLGTTRSLSEVAKERQERRSSRKGVEEEAQQKEQQKEEEILRAIAELGENS